MKIRIFFRFFIIGQDRRSSGIQEKLNFYPFPFLRKLRQTHHRPPSFQIFNKLAFFP
mgnify:CR=1 FL=1